MPSRMSRNALRASAIALAVGLLSLGAPSAGRAAEAGLSLEFVHDLGDKPVRVEPYEGELGGRASLTARSTGSRELTDFTVTVDATALEGQMKLSGDPSACVEKQPLVLVCDGRELHGGEPLRPGDLLDGPSLDFTALAAAKPGFTGEVKVFGEAGGARLGQTVFKAAVKDVGPVIDQGRDFSTTTRPGTTVHPVVGFTHYSARPLKGVYVDITLSQGLSHTEEFSNCEYGKRDDYGVEARCYVQTPVEPGGSYDFDQLSLKVGGSALHDSWRLYVREAAGRSSSPLTGVHRGTGRELKLVPRAGGPGTMEFGEARGGVEVANSMDFAAVGDTVDGKAGQVVKVELGARNIGPATIANSMGEPGEGVTSYIDVKLPAGTTAVKAPDLCSPWNGSGDGKPGAKRYTCRQDYEGDFYFDAGQVTPFVFELRIDEPGALAPGSIRVSRPLEDNKAENNTAPITVTVDGRTGGGPGPGGTGPLPWYSAAAVALAAGATLFTVARRRKANRRGLDVGDR
ncbi:hypothetical protein [Streptomyces sp. NPDC048106]|uniref:hypothetical protein n=1 Tax=Streptomyces sp. NPDC048106 TaxID=3155750 RepID=UPI0034535965